MPPGSGSGRRSTADPEATGPLTLLRRRVQAVAAAIDPIAVGVLRCWGAHDIQLTLPIAHLIGALLQPTCLLHRPAQPEPGTGTHQRAQRTTGSAADHQPGAHAQPSADCGITHFRHHLLRHCGDTAQSKYRCYHACSHLHAISPVDTCTGTYSGSMPVADLTKIKDMRRCSHPINNHLPGKNAQTLCNTHPRPPRT